MYWIHLIQKKNDLRIHIVDNNCRLESISKKVNFFFIKLRTINVFIIYKFKLPKKTYFLDQPAISDQN